jgi:HlyD family secretion protein
MRKWIIGGVVLIAAGLIAIPLLTGGGPNRAGAQTSGATGTVERADLQVLVESSGSIVPAEQLTLTFGANGTVQTIYVEEGAAVQAGDVLAALDLSDLDYQVRVREQALAQQQASYDALIAPPTADEIARAQASLAQAQAQLATNQLQATNAPNQVTQSCAGLAAAAQTLTNAQDAYDDYVTDGYSHDATFLPDSNAEASTRLRDAQSAFDSAQARCQTSEAEADKTLSLVSAQAAVEQAQTALDALLAGPAAESIAQSQALLDQRKLELENAQNALADAQLVAPFDGVVTHVGIDIGQIVSGQVQAITLMDVSQLYMDVDVDEADIAAVQPGQPVSILLNALEGATLTGSVVRVAPAGDLIGGVVTYTVRVLLDESEMGVLPGMTADADIQVGTEDGVLVVPTEAIQRDEQGQFIQVANQGGDPVAVYITVGMTQGSVTAVQGDLTAGQIVYLRPQPVAAGGGFFPPAPGG